MSAQGLHFKLFFSNPASTPFDEKDFSEFQTFVETYASPNSMRLAGPGNFIYALQKAVQFQAHLKFFESQRAAAQESARAAYQNLERQSRPANEPSELLAKLSLAEPGDSPVFRAYQEAIGTLQHLEGNISRISKALSAFQIICSRLGIEPHHVEAKMD